MKDKGWISIHRKITENKFWLSEKFTKGQAWIDILLLANHKENVIDIRGNLVTIPRGYLGWSEESLSKRWKWSRGKVRRFFLVLQTEQQIVQHKSSILSLVQVINYNKYQDNSTTNSTTDSTTDGQQTVQQTDTNNNVNNVNNVNNDNKKEKRIKKNKYSDKVIKIYKYYLEELKPDSRYNEPSTTKGFIKDLLKEYSDKELKVCIDNYKKYKEVGYTLKPSNFFSNNKRKEKYRIFENYLPENVTDIEKAKMAEYIKKTGYDPNLEIIN